jgi:hypothetical protein
VAAITNMLDVMSGLTILVAVCNRQDRKQKVMQTYKLQGRSRALFDTNFANCQSKHAQEEYDEANQDGESTSVL